MPHEIVLSGDVGWEITAKDIRASLAGSGGDDILFLANSPGGFVSESLEIFNLIRSYKGNTEARITGVAASAMSYIILAADKVTAHENAVFMIHNAWNLAIGDHHDMRKVAAILESLSNIYAKEYVNASGKAIGNIKSLMDDTTFFFGDEIMAEGFVDEIIESEDSDDDDKAISIIKARASMDTCLKRMRNSEAANKDFEKAVAYVDTMSLLGEPKAKTPSEGDPDKLSDHNTNDLTPAVAGQQKQEDKQLKTLAELLTENPSAKAEHDILITTARTEGVAEAKDGMKAVIAKVSPVLTSTEYSADVKEAGINAIIGDGPIATFQTLVVLADRDTEKAKAEAAKKESEKSGETPGASGDKLTDAEAAAETKKKKDAVLAQGGF